MASLSLRFRIFLFFSLIAGGSVALLGVGLFLGFRQSAGDISPFVTAGVVSGLGIIGLTTFVWLLFDEHVAKAVEGMAAQLRVRTHSDVGRAIDHDIAKYLGDLAPAALAVHEKLTETSSAVDQTVAAQTNRLRKQRDQLLRILSDLPIATIVAQQDHQIVLYDGQAADLMEREAPARLNGSVFDYLDESAIRAVLSELATSQSRRQSIALVGKSGATYSGHIRLFDDDAGYTLMLEPLSPDASRPLVYDLDLMTKRSPSDPNTSMLRDLCYVVFDSETTGLSPVKDDVLQLGAVRIVNGKIVETERFDALVNPGRPIPAASTKVHGISDAMVRDAQPFSEVSRQFHKFAKGAVIIAHNAPFDMAFLHRISKRTGQNFDHPVLDTVHLSAIVFGGSAEHTLDALCARLDIRIPEDLRHTAIGDAQATAEVFVAMLPLLEARGLMTYGAVKDEMQKHGRILEVV